MKSILLFLSLTIIFIITSCISNDKENKEIPGPNVLFISVDDLRTELNCYGSSHIVSPNIDQLASEGVLFREAYTQQAVCAPSRNTLLTGIRPDGLGIHDLSTFFRTKAPDIKTLPQHFMKSGYVAEGMGKIYHTGHGNQNDTLSWSNPFWTPSHIVNNREPRTSGDTTHLHTSFPLINEKRIPWLRSLMPDEWLDDGLAAQHAIQRLRALKDTTFFLAVGFRKPHLPFVAPAKYWDLYDPDEIEVPSKDKPDVPPYAFSNWGELRKYHGMPATGYMSENDAKKLIQGYYACVSYIDAQIGLITEELKKLDLYDNTIIVLWGDHGWKLGDYGEWCKHTNYEIDTRIPVLVKKTGAKPGEGRNTDLIVETVDIYPTLCEMAGLEIPSHIQGTSFAPVLDDANFHWDDVAFSQYPRRPTINGKKRNLMGTSMRTADFRLTRWEDQETGELLATELYDHRDKRFESDNKANDQAYQKNLKKLNDLFQQEYERKHK